MELSEQMGTYLHFVIMPCQILTMLFLMRRSQTKVGYRVG